MRLRFWISNFPPSSPSFPLIPLFHDLACLHLIGLLSVCLLFLFIGFCCQCFVLSASSLFDDLSLQNFTLHFHFSLYSFLIRMTQFTHSFLYCIPSLLYAHLLIPKTLLKLDSPFRIFVFRACSHRLLIPRKKVCHVT